MRTKKLTSIIVAFGVSIAYADSAISPYQVVSSMNSPIRFNMGGEWRAAEKIISKNEMSQLIGSVASWNKDDFISKFCSGLGKTYKQNFIQKNLNNMEYTVSDYGGKGSVIGCVFSWKSPKGYDIKIINLVEKGGDNNMYMLAMFY